MKEMLAPPTSAEREQLEPQVGASAATSEQHAEGGRGERQRAQPGAPAGGHDQPADDRAEPHRGGHEAVAAGAGVQRPAAITGSVTWNSYAEAPASAIITSGTASSRIPAT